MMTKLNINTLAEGKLYMIQQFYKTHKLQLFLKKTSQTSHLIADYI